MNELGYLEFFLTIDHRFYEHEKAATQEHYSGPDTKPDCLDNISHLLVGNKHDHKTDKKTGDDKWLDSINTRENGHRRNIDKTGPYKVVEKWGDVVNFRMLGLSGEANKETSEYKGCEQGVEHTKTGKFGNRGDVHKTKDFKGVDKWVDHTSTGAYGHCSISQKFRENIGVEMDMVCMDIGDHGHDSDTLKNDDYVDVNTTVNCTCDKKYGHCSGCCRAYCDVDNNCNNNSSSSSSSGGSSESVGLGGSNSKQNVKPLGKTPLSVLKKEKNSWSLVPTTQLDTNRNQEGGCVHYEDWPGSLGMKKGVYLETPHIDFLLCMARSDQSKDDIMSRCETALMAADVNNVTESYLIAAKYGLVHVMDTLLELIRDNFILVSQTKQFLELPVDLMELFLSDTFVNVGDELDVFAAALRWVDYNKQERLAQSGRVLNCIRYEKIRPIDIRDHVEPNIHLFNGPCGPEALVNIYRKHALDCAGVADDGPLGPRPTHDELVQEMAMKPATTPGRQHATIIAAADPSGKVAAGMKGKGGGKGGKKPAAKGGPEKAEGKAKEKSKDKNASRHGINNNFVPETTSAGATVLWLDSSTSNSAAQGAGFSRGSRSSMFGGWRVAGAHADPSPDGTLCRSRRKSHYDPAYSGEHRSVTDREGSRNLKPKRKSQKLRKF